MINIKANLKLIEINQCQKMVGIYEMSNRTITDIYRQTFTDNAKYGICFKDYQCIAFINKCLKEGNYLYDYSIILENDKHILGFHINSKSFSSCILFDGIETQIYTKDDYLLLIHVYTNIRTQIENTQF